MRRSLLPSACLAGLLAAGLALPHQASAADEVRTIDIVKNADGKFVFSVPKAKIEAGQTVKWNVKDANIPHQLVPDTDADAFTDTGEFNSTNPPKQKFTTPGVIKYHCSIHPKSMQGSIRVVGAEAPAAEEPPAASSDEAPAVTPKKEPAPAKKAPAKKPSYNPY